MAIILSGSSSMFDAMVFGNGNRSGQDYLNQLNANFMQNVQAPVLNAYQNMMQTSMFQTFREDAMQHLRAMGRGLVNAFQPNGVYELYTIGELQHANHVMQRWIMACPEVRTLYHKQEVDGYSDTYVDRSPNSVGLDHYEYRRVTDGITMDHGTGDYERYRWTEDLLHADDNLTFDEQMSIIYTWSKVQDYISKGKDDPTSRFNNAL